MIKIYVIGAGSINLAREIIPPKEALVLLVENGAGSTRPQKRGLPAFVENFTQPFLEIDNFYTIRECFPPSSYPIKKDFYQTPKESLPNYCEKRFYPQCERISVKPYKNKFLKRENRKARLQKLRKK